jgi:hypothetical protein
MSMRGTGSRRAIPAQESILPKTARPIGSGQIPNAIPLARRRRGVTLIEAVLYIAIALALIVGGLVFYQQASFASRVNRVTSTASSLISETRVLAVQNGSWSEVPGILENVLIAQGSVPSSELDMTKPLGERIRHPWDSFILLSLVDGGPGAVNYLTFAMFNVPVSACTRLAWFDGRGTGAFATNITSATAWDDVTGSTPAASILVNDRSGAVCRNRDLNGNGRVSFSMQLDLRD